jgi:hypothetical protein
MSSGNRRPSQVMDCELRECPVIPEVKDLQLTVKQFSEWSGVAKAILWLLGIGLPVVFSVAAWAFGIAWGHEGRITITETEAKNAARQSEQFRAETREDIKQILQILRERVK